MRKGVKTLYGDNFRAVFLENTPFEEQVRLFNNAKLIIGVHGAGFANNLFCKKGSIVLEITHPSIPPSWSYFTNISRLCGLVHVKCDDNLNEIIEWLKMNAVEW